MKYGRRNIQQSTYPEVYKESIENPIQFWERAANKITWFKKYDKVFDDSRKINDGWFRGKFPTDQTLLTRWYHECLL